MNLDQVAKLLPEFVVAENHTGIRVSHDEYSCDDRLPMIGDLMRCAISLGLTPDQIVDNSEYVAGNDWGGMTGRESDIVRFDVTFLRSPPKGNSNSD